MKIAIRGLSKRFGGVVAVDRVTLEVAACTLQAQPRCRGLLGRQHHLCLCARLRGCDGLSGAALVYGDGALDEDGDSAQVSTFFCRIKAAISRRFCRRLLVR